MATDNGSGDDDPNAGIIQYVNDTLGYNFRITSTTNLSTSTQGDIASSELSVINLSGTQGMVIVIQEDFNRPAGLLGSSVLSQSLTRNRSSGLGTSGTVSLTTMATSASGGGTGSAARITFSDPLGAAGNTGNFNRTSGLYTLVQTITINGLAINNGVFLTANSNVTGPTPAPLTHAPAPSAAVLLLTGLPVLGLYGRRYFRKS